MVIREERKAEIFYVENICLDDRSAIRGLHPETGLQSLRGPHWKGLPEEDRRRNPESQAPQEASLNGNLYRALSREVSPSTMLFRPPVFRTGYARESGYSVFDLVVKSTICCRCLKALVIILIKMCQNNKCLGRLRMGNGGPIADRCPDRTPYSQFRLPFPIIRLVKRREGLPDVELFRTSDYCCS